MSLLSIAQFQHNDISLVLWLTATSDTQRYQLSITDAARLWNTIVDLKDSPPEYPDGRAYKELVLRCLGHQDTGSFHYEFDNLKDSLQLSVSRLISTTAGAIRQGLFSTTLQSNSECRTEIMSLLLQCISKIDTLRLERRKIRFANERLVKENAQLQEFHDKACEAKLISEEEIISRIASLQAKIERNLLRDRDVVNSHIQHQDEREQSPPRLSQSPVKEAVSGDVSGIEAALNQATKSDLIQPSIHKGRKRRTAKAGNKAVSTTSSQHEKSPQGNKRLKAGYIGSEDLISQLE